MWAFVLISIYFFLVYISLGTIWLILGAIVNPNAFLPYATAALTFITTITIKFISSNSNSNINKML